MVYLKDDILDNISAIHGDDYYVNNIEIEQLKENLNDSIISELNEIAQYIISNRTLTITQLLNGGYFIDFLSSYNGKMFPPRYPNWKTQWLRTDDLGMKICLCVFCQRSTQIDNTFVLTKEDLEELILNHKERIPLKYRVLFAEGVRDG